MADKFSVSLKIRRIDNGYILTGKVAKGSGERDQAEEYYADLAGLDRAIADRLANAEVVAADIEEVAVPVGGIMWSSGLWGRSSGDDDDD